MNSPILSTGARLLVPLFLAISLYILFRGHNAPGGGFIGGLVAASGFAIRAFASGSAAARASLRFDPLNIGGAGLVCALIAGVYASLTGGAPFEGVWGEVLGLPVSTVMLFDIGVYLAVVGGVMALVLALEDSSEGVQ